VAKEAKGTFLEQVDTKGKAVIDRWEREFNNKRQGKAWGELIKEADGIRDPGANTTQENPLPQNGGGSVVEKNDDK
jgi:hypothetical protein